MLRRSIIVLSQYEMQTFTAEKPYAVISISDPVENEAGYSHFRPIIPESPKLLGILSLNFHDLTQQLGKGGYTLFTPEMAEKVIKFVVNHLPNMHLLVIHCGFGKSRSPAVATAISEWLHGNPGSFVLGKRYLPNPFVLELMRNELKKHSQPLMRSTFYDKIGQKITRGGFVYQAKESVKKDYFSRQEIELDTNLTKTQVDNAVRRKQIKTCLFRGRTYYSKEDVMNLMAKRIEADNAQPKLL